MSQPKINATVNEVVEAIKKEFKAKGVVLCTYQDYGADDIVLESDEPFGIDAITEALSTLQPLDEREVLTNEMRVQAVSDFIKWYDNSCSIISRDEESAYYAYLSKQSDLAQRGEAGK